MTSPTQSPGTSELRELAEAALANPVRPRLDRDYNTDAHFAAMGARDNLHAACAPEVVLALLDDLAAAQGEVERLREALKPFARIGDLVERYEAQSGKPSTKEYAEHFKAARSALTLKLGEEGLGGLPEASSSASGASVCSANTLVIGEEEQRCIMCFGKLKSKEGGGRECESCGAVWVEGT